MKSPLNYNHIIFFPGDYYHYVFGDADSSDCAAFLEMPKVTLPVRVVNRIQHSGRIPRRLRPHLFRLMYRRMIHRIRAAAKKMADPYLDRMVRQRNENRFADLICTYNPVEAEKYGIAFHNLPYTDISGRFAGVREETDVFFIGKAKERYAKFLKVWEDITGRGFSFAAYLFDVPEDRRKNAPEGIRFSDWVPYEEYLAKAAKSRVLLEIVQKDRGGNTLRVNEAVMLGKKLISDNQALKDNPIYDPENMFVFDKPGEIPEEFLRGSAVYRPEQKQQLSLQVFLEDLEHMLTEDKQY